ncbi:aminotransferase class IV [Streptomyces sp. NPDC088554]|uniref:aminotransferase class IV n=1 Tax=Streptomyces sp. NPDC088554 TaxID=3365865 RepID=UPI0037FE2299
MPLYTSAALYGASVFDNCRAWHADAASLVYGLAEHIERFKESAEEALLTLPSDAEITAGIWAVLRRCRGRTFVRVRMLAYGTGHDIGSRQSSLSVFALPVAGYAPAAPHLMTTKTVRRAEGDLPRALKSPSTYLRVRRDVVAAREAGYDDLVVLNEHQRVSEATRSNIVMVKDGTLCTPPLNEGALPGITKRILRRLAVEDGIPWEERPIHRKELDQAEALLLTSSSLGVVVADSLDGRRFGPSPLAAQIQRRYTRLPEEHPDHECLTSLADEPTSSPEEAL